MLLGLTVLAVLVMNFWMRTFDILMNSKVLKTEFQKIRLIPIRKCIRNEFCYFLDDSHTGPENGNRSQVPRESRNGKQALISKISFQTTENNPKDIKNGYGGEPNSAESKEVDNITYSQVTEDNKEIMKLMIVRNNSVKTGTVREWLSFAAASFKCTFIPTFDKISQDPYFQTPSKALQPDLPPLLVNPTDVCSESQPPFLLLLVLSSYRDNSENNRQSVRSTYGSVARGGQWPGRPLVIPVRLVFLLGKPPSQLQWLLVKADIKEHGDIIVGDFIDSYRNLTLKVLLGLRWTVDHCRRVRYVMKADDDTFINLPLLTTFLLERGERNSIYGHMYLHAPVQRGGQWAVSNSTYPLDSYPPYLSGTAYVLSQDAVESLLEASRYFPLLPVEDVYITGVLAVAGGVRRMFTQGFTYLNDLQTNICDFVLDLRFVGNCRDKYVLWNTLRIDDRRLCGADKVIPRMR